MHYEQTVTAKHLKNYICVPHITKSSPGFSAVKTDGLPSKNNIRSEKH